MRKFLLPFVVVGLAACGDEGAGIAPEPTASAPQPVVEQATQAARSDITWQGTESGVTPFIAFVTLAGRDLADVRSVSYVIEPKAGSVSKPVHVTYLRQALDRQGRLQPDGTLRLPVFGLYSGHENQVSFELSFEDCSTQSIAGTLTTAAYVDPTGAYSSLVFIKNRAAGSALGFDFFAMKSGLGTPVVVDTDGEIRWVGASNESSISSIYTDNGFVIGDQRSTKVRRLELDGTERVVPLDFPGYRRFHHNIDPGKTGLLGEFDTFTDRETTVAEFTLTDGVIKQWDFAQIMRDHLTAAGEDPSLLVRPPIDWFHTNSITYDARDDSLIVSAREHFILNVDYDTGAIRWVLGDPTKYWWSFPSLRAKALTLDDGGLYPIGHHATSITSDGLLLLFNAGQPSEAQPAGAPIGEARTYSAVSAYRIDFANMRATEVWHFDYGQQLFSDHCSSVYEGPDQSLLITYSRAENLTRTRIVALNAQHEVVFDFDYPSRGCGTSWNSFPIAFENLRFES